MRGRVARVLHETRQGLHGATTWLGIQLGRAIKTSRVAPEKQSNKNGTYISSHEIADLALRCSLAASREPSISGTASICGFCPFLLGRMPIFIIRPSTLESRKAEDHGDFSVRVDRLAAKRG